MRQQQFLNVIDRDEAEKRYRAVLDLSPLESEVIALEDALGRVLSEDVIAAIDVPNFDRANVDGYAVRSEDTFGATEERPVHLELSTTSIATGVVPEGEVGERQAVAIATGGVVPRGSSAVVMVEHTDAAANSVAVRRPVTPGENVTFTGTDISRGETVLRKGESLSSRETGVLAAIGMARVPVVRRPRVAVISTGNEIVAPGGDIRVGQIFDSNLTIIADAVRELGGEPARVGIVPDDEALLESVLKKALQLDIVLVSGGTSKGEGDLSSRVVGRLGSPGIIVHGVALKPGKPLCLAAVQPSAGRTRPVIILPGFPTSAIFTFHEFVAPIILRLGGRQKLPPRTIQAHLPARINSERGRTDCVMVNLVSRSPASRVDRKQDSPGYAAIPIGKGSGSVTSFSAADGYFVIPRQREFLERNSLVEVRLINRDIRPADLVVVGSHCVGLDFLLSRLRDRGFTTKFLAVGSSAGFAGAERGDCDVSGIHLLDVATGVYNRPFVTGNLRFLPGYGRRQGIVYRADDRRFVGRTLAQIVDAAIGDPNCLMVNRNRGSGTRVLIDGLLATMRPKGFLIEVRSHTAVAAAVLQGRADWGVAIEQAAAAAGLRFMPVQEERFDFVIAHSANEKPAVQMFEQLLSSEETRTALRQYRFLI